MELSREVLQAEEFVRRCRRELHRIPEIALAEQKTQQFLISELKSMGFKPRSVGTGIIVDVKGTTNKRDKSIALRADMDALPISEQTGAEYTSEHEGMMHACGHDGHMAMLLGIAKLMSQSRPRYNVRLIFQPAEENCGGAESMIEAGVLDGVGEIYALHVAPFYDLGTVSTGAGALLAGVVDADITFYGVKSHVADSDKKDALAAAVRFYCMTGEFMKKYGDKAILHMGVMNGGTIGNVVADEARQKWTLRYFRDEDKEAITMDIAHALNAACDECGTDHRFVVTGFYPPVVNASYAFMVAQNSYPVEQAEQRFTAEDFAFYCNEVPGCFAWLGTCDEKHSSGLHMPTFDFDEHALLYGVEYFRRLVY